MPMQPSLNLRVSAEGHQGDRKYMEDFTSVEFQRDGEAEVVFLAVYDGHGGTSAAIHARQYLWKNIQRQPGFYSRNDRKVTAAIREAFLETHESMWKQLPFWPQTSSGLPSTSGTTISCAILRGRKMFVGHIGDSGILLGQSSDNYPFIRAIPLTKDHKPEEPAELNRILNAGGKVLSKCGVPRVVWRRPDQLHKGVVRRSTELHEVPFLAVARSLGDLWSYDFIREKYTVSPEPDVSVRSIDLSRDKFLIFATDGLWNVVRSQQLVEYINQKDSLNNRRESWTGHISHSIINQALKTYRDHGIRADNTSVIVVFFDPPEASETAKQPGFHQEAHPRLATVTPRVERNSLGSYEGPLSVSSCVPEMQTMVNPIGRLDELVKKVGPLLDTTSPLKENTVKTPRSEIRRIRPEPVQMVTRSQIASGRKRRTLPPMLHLDKRRRSMILC